MNKEEQEKVSENSPILDDEEIIDSGVKNDPEPDINTTDVARVAGGFYIVGIDEGKPRIIRKKDNQEDTEPIAIK